MAYKPKILDSTEGGTGASNTPTSGKALIGNGSAFVTSTASFPATAGATGTLLRSDGTNWVATTSTYPDTNAVSTLVYASASNVLSALATANNGILVTNNTGVPSLLAGPGTTGNVLQSNAAAAPSYSTATYPSVATSTGSLLRANGTNWAVTTSTYPDTNAVSTLLYASSANVMGALATANNGLLVTSSTGVPSVLAGPGATGRVLQSNAAAAPSFSTATFPSTATGTGTILRADGTNWVPTTATFPTTAGTSGNILTSDGTNWTSATPAAGGLTWTVITADQSVVVSNGYICNKAGTLTLTLPASSTAGDIFEVTGINTATGWKIAQNANQQIFIGTSSTTIGAGGSVASINIRDSCKLICVVAGASSNWNVISSVGNFTIV